MIAIPPDGRETPAPNTGFPAPASVAPLGAAFQAANTGRTSAWLSCCDARLLERGGLQRPPPCIRPALDSDPCSRVEVRAASDLPARQELPRSAGACQHRRIGTPSGVP